MLDQALEPLFDGGWISEVIRPVRSGKEATVYLCRAHARIGDDLLAAKVYRATQRRGFKNDAVYREGGDRMLSRRLRLAMTKHSAFGQRAAFGHWIGRELETLETLVAAGASVPRPVTQEGSVLLMSWIGDREGGAPHLRHADLDPARAGRVFDFLAGQVELWLTHNVVHGDLSEYNVLFWRGRPVVIDFPQAVDPRFNHSAHALLQRDLANLLRAFERWGVRRDPRALAAGIWERWLRAESRFDPAPALDLTGRPDEAGL